MYAKFTRRWPGCRATRLQIAGSEDDIEAKLLLLAEDLHHVDKTTYQVFEDFTIDVTDQNEVNQIVFGTGAPYTKGTEALVAECAAGS